MFVAALSLVSLGIWIGLWLAWAGFWRIDRDLAPPPAADWDDAGWPSIVVIIPARNEAPVVAETLRSLWAQNYPGPFHIILIDDHSDDGTAEVARGASEACRPPRDLRVLSAEPLPPGWAGKVWAMHQGYSRGLRDGALPDYVLFSDADISHGPEVLRELVCRAEAGSCHLVSLMVRLQCSTPAERWMIPAFVFFFRLLYPFRKVNDPQDRLAGAAGGTMLVRRDALERIGGLTAIRSEIIDDCSLARAIKAGGHRLWIGLSQTSRSTRGYDHLRGIVDMIARTAYTQLGYSPAALVGCFLGLGLPFLTPPALAFSGGGWTSLAGAAAWILMTGLYLPMVRFYNQSPLWTPLLPVTAALYLWATVLSAWRHHHGHGGQWKGRTRAGSGS